MKAQHKIAVGVAEAFVGRALKVLVERKASAKDIKSAQLHSWEHGLIRDTDRNGSRLSGEYLVARGEAEIGFQQISELLPIEGIDYVGPLPAEVQRITLFSAGVATRSHYPAAAQDFIKFLASPDAAEITAQSGLAPIKSH